MTEAINRISQTFIDRDGIMFPVTNWLDDAGEDCAPIDATRAVAGEGRRWYTIDLRDFTEQVQ